METRRISRRGEGRADRLPDAASLAALRAWYEGIPAREAVVRFLGHTKADGQSSRGMIGAIRRQLIVFTRRRHREDLATLFAHPASERIKHARPVLRAIELLPSLPASQPLIGDDIDQWLEPRAVQALRAQGIKTLAALTLRIANEGCVPHTVMLGADVMVGQRPQAIVPAGAWQAAESTGDWTLVGCTVAPGFEFAGFELAGKDWLPAG